MLHNKRARALIIVLGLACAVVLALVVVSRVMALQVRILNNPTVLTVNAGGTTSVTLPLNRAVPISIAETGSGSSGSAFIVADCSGGTWAWAGLNGDGTKAGGQTVTTVGTAMCKTMVGQYARVKDLNGGVTFVAGTTPMRVLIHY
jgi:hypothetical protein